MKPAPPRPKYLLQEAIGQLRGATGDWEDTAGTKTSASWKGWIWGVGEATGRLWEATSYWEQQRATARSDELWILEILDMVSMGSCWETAGGLLEAGASYCMKRGGAKFGNVP